MNASLTALPVAVTGTDTSASPSGNIPANQQDTSTPNGFGVLLQQAAGVLGAQSVTPGQGTETLTEQLQGLPQGGKLLPLLQQVLDAAAAEGTSADEVFNDLAERLEQLTADSELEPGQAIAAVIQQFIDDNPRLASSVDSSLLRTASGQNALTLSGDSIVRPDDSRVQSADFRTPSADPGARPQTPQQITAATSAASSVAGASGDVSGPGQRSLAGQEKLAAGLMPVTPDQREGALSEAISLFRRLASGSRAAAVSESQLRGDTVLTHPGSLTTPASSVTPMPSVPSVPNAAINVPLNQAGWDQALAERIQWMVGQGMQRASIKLNPANLGPMEVRIQIQNDQASVQFTSAHGVVREALEAAMPRLRDMFDNSGVALTDVDVSGQSFAEQQQAAAGDGRGAAAGGGSRHTLFDVPGDVESILETPVYSLSQTGRLDLFA